MGIRKRVLVTGGAGFLGSYLCRRLLSLGDEVICLDNFFTGFKSNILDLLSEPYFEFIRHDVINPIELEVDEIYNLACPASPLHYQYNPIKTVKTNVLGVTNMLGLARRLGVKLLQASTSEVYGDPEEHPQSETYLGHVNPVGIRSCYDEGKRVAETLCMDYKRTHNLDIKIVRIFNTYGPYMSYNDGRVVSNFIVSALRGEDISIYGDGSQTRSFCYVSDLVGGLIDFMSLGSGGDNLINLGNPEEVSISDLAALVLDSIPGSGSLIRYFDLPEDDPAKRCPDISRARDLIGFSPQVSLEDGLKRTVSYFRGILF